MSTCSRCGAPFGCALADGLADPCWCTALPPALPVPDAPARCWCKACLEDHIKQQTAPDPQADRPAG